MLPAMRRHLPLVAVLLLAVVVWSPALSGELLADDVQFTQIIRRNVSLDDGFDLSDLGELLGAYTHPWKKNPNLVRPSVYVSHALHLLTTGVNPRPFLWVNLAAHILNGLLLWGLLARVLPNAPRWACHAATAAFLTSPFAIEPIAWSAARSDLFMTTFGLAGLLLWLRGGGWRLMSYVAVACALTFKESAIVYVAALGILELFPADGESLETVRNPIRRLRWRRLAGPIVLGATYLAWRGHMLAGVAEAKYQGKSLLETVGSMQALRNVWQSTLRFFAPVSTLVVRRPVLMQVLVGPVLVTAFLRGFLAMKGRFRWLALAVLVVPGGLGVTVGAILPTLFHGRQAYGSLPGLAVFLAAALARGPRPLRWLLCSALLALVPLSVLEARASADMGRRMMSLVRAVREPVFSRADPPARGVIVLRWETKLFHGMAVLPPVILHDLLQPPFTARDVEVLTVRKTEQLAALVFRDTKEYAFAVLGREEESPGIEAVVPSRFALRPEASVELLAPSQGWIHPVRGDPATTGLDLKWRSPAPPGSRFVVGVLGARLGVAEQSPPSSAVDVAEHDGTYVYSLHIPQAVIASRARGIQGREALGCYVKLVNDEGRVLGCTGVGLFFISGQ